MNISLEQFKKEVEQLDVEMNNHFKEIPNQTKQHLKAKTGRQLIRDGIVDIEEYYKSPIRIMWVLKEPYDNKKNGGGGWAMKEILFKMVNGEKPKPQSTWHPIIYSTFGILNNFRKLETMPRIGNDKTVAAVLKQIAFINVQKLPATTVTIDKEQEEAYQENRNILLKQISTYQPHIVIGGSTLHLFKNDLAITEQDMLGFGHFNKNKRLFINTSHPAQRNTKRIEYVNKIIARAEQWKDKYQ